MNHSFKLLVAVTVLVGALPQAKAASTAEQVVALRLEVEKLAAEVATSRRRLAARNESQGLEAEQLRSQIRQAELHGRTLRGALNQSAQDAALQSESAKAWARALADVVTHTRAQIKSGLAVHMARRLSRLDDIEALAQNPERTADAWLRFQRFVSDEARLAKTIATFETSLSVDGGKAFWAQGVHVGLSLAYAKDRQGRLAMMTTDTSAQAQRWQFIVATPPLKRAINDLFERVGQGQAYGLSDLVVTPEFFADATQGTAQ